MPPLATLLAKPLVKYGVPVLAVVGIIAGFFIWLHFHDRGVIKRENEALNEAAREMGEEARQAADANQIDRQEQFNASQDALRNSSNATDYLRRLRAQQDRERAPAAR